MAKFPSDLRMNRGELRVNQGNLRVRTEKFIVRRVIGENPIFTASIHDWGSSYSKKRVRLSVRWLSYMAKSPFHFDFIHF